MNNKEHYNKIEFREFKVYADKTGFECTVTADDHSQADVIFFRFNAPVGDISNNLIFAALMTLVGKEWYENAYFDLSVSQHIYDRAIKVSKSKIEVRDFNYAEDVNKRNSYSGTVLNLSGGIDSNALYYLMKRGGVDFVSINTNFGEEFSRDVEVTKDRVDLVMTTNIRNAETKYVSDYKTWTFMGIASILTVDHFQTKNILFGQVNQYDRYMRTLLKDKDRKVCRSNNNFFSTIGCETYGIQFLTEFQNAIVLLDNVHDNELIQKISDASATQKHAEKFFRKQMFLLVAQKFLGMKHVDYSKYKFLNEDDRFNKRFIENVNSMTLKDKNLVLILGLKYLGYIPKGIENEIFSKVGDFAFIENVYLKDIPTFYLNFLGVVKYLSELFKVEEK